MAKGRISLIFGAALAAAILGPRPALAARSIFLAADTAGTSCSITVSPFVVATFYILADPDGGLTGAEFRVTGMPGTQGADWLVSSTPAAGASLSLGDPFGDVGANIAFFTCQATDPTLLYMVGLTILNPMLPLTDVTLTVEARNPSTVLGFDCPLHTLCDSPDFNPVCVAGGQLVLNPSGGPIDCPLFPENTPTPTPTPSPTVTPTSTPTATPTIGATQPKQQICHIPPDDPQDAHTISISERALDAHLAHGDCLGECPCAECEVDADCAEGYVCDAHGQCSGPYQVRCECSQGGGVVKGPCTTATQCDTDFPYQWCLENSNCPAAYLSTGCDAVCEP